jgi:hypothetical protein
MTDVTMHPHVPQNRQAFLENSKVPVLLPLPDSL